MFFISSVFLLAGCQKEDTSLQEEGITLQEAQLLVNAQSKGQNQFQQPFTVQWETFTQQGLNKEQQPFASVKIVFEKYPTLDTQFFITQTAKGLEGKIGISFPKSSFPTESSITEGTIKDDSSSYTARDVEFPILDEYPELRPYKRKLKDIYNKFLSNNCDKCKICRNCLFNWRDMQQVANRLERKSSKGNNFFPSLCDECNRFSQIVVSLTEVVVVGERKKREEYFTISTYIPPFEWDRIKLLWEMPEVRRAIREFNSEERGGAGGPSAKSEEYIIYENNVPDRMRDIIDDLGSYNGQGLPIPYVSKNDSPLTPFILNLFRPSKAFHITFRIGQLTSQADYQAGIFSNGETTKIPGLTHYNITLDERLLKEGSNLAIAKTIIHETLHAYMLMQLDRMRIESQYNDMAERLIFLYNSQPNEKKNANMTQHKLMTEFVEAMAESLARYDRGQHSLEYYRLMSWGGLEETDEYKALPEAEKEKIKRILYDELTKNRP